MGGVCGFLSNGWIKFFVLESVLRRILPREWDIWLKDIEASNFAFFHHADVLGKTAAGGFIASCNAYLLVDRALREGGIPLGYTPG